MKRIIVLLRLAVRRRFNLHEDKDEDKKIVDTITRNVEFRGANLWALIFAIFIASIGLNVNSTAVIIGAMLISPLMGPILGIGLGIGISDFSLLKRSLQNFGLATGISIVTSALYFYFTPLHNANSELLARTNPSIWDVFIAFFGGLAGTVATSRKEKSNVIPGVAIATALMPPLCTAGFGLATANWYYMAGALYLFFINTVFISTASYIIITLLHIPSVAFESPSRKKQVNKYMVGIVVVTLLPSIYFAYNIVRKSIFENDANNFITNELNNVNTQILSKTFSYNRLGHNEISLLLIGSELPQDTINSLQKKLEAYNLKDTRLFIKQGLNAKQQIDISQIRASILEDVFSQQTQEDTIQQKKGMAEDSLAEIASLKNELKVLFPAVETYSVNRSVFFTVDSTKKDTLMLFAASVSKPVYRAEQAKLHDWLKTRLSADSIVIVFSRK